MVELVHIPGLMSVVDRAATTDLGFCERGGERERERESEGE